MNFLIKFPKVGFIFFSILGLLLKPAVSQVVHSKSFGNPHVQVIHPNDQNQSGEYCQILQDGQDNIFIAAVHGVLKFNGKGWLFAGMPGQVHMALSEDQILYAGGDNTFGIVGTDHEGRFGLTSLAGKGLQSGFNVGHISRIITLRDQVCILSEKGLFIYKNGSFTGILSGITLHDIFKVNNQIYVYASGLGLQLLTDTSLTPLLQVDQLDGHHVNDVFSMDEKIYITTDGEKKIYQVSDNQIMDASLPFLQKSPGIKILKSKKINDRYLLLITENNDLMVCDASGDPVTIVTGYQGIGESEIRDIYFDGADNLWLLHEHALSRVELFSPVTFISLPDVNSGETRSIARSGNQLLISTSKGLYTSCNVPCHQVQSAKSIRSLFDHPVDCHDMVPFGNSMLVSSSDGIYQYSPGSGLRLVFPVPARLIARSVSDTLVVYSGLETGISLLKYENNEWTDLGMAEGIDRPLTSIAETKDRFVWAGTYNSGLFRATVPERFLPGIKIGFAPVDIWPETAINTIRLFYLDNTLLASTSSGLLQYDEASGAFTLYPVQPYTPGQSKLMEPVVAGNKDTAWFSCYDAQTDRTILMSFDPLTNDPEAADTLEYRRLDNLRIYSMFDDQNGLWLATSDGPVRINKNYSPPESPHFFTFIDRIIISKDSVIERTFLDAHPTLGQESPWKLIIPHSRNYIRFEFVSTDYNSEGDALFQYLLTDKKKAWSDWTNHTFADLQDLPAGRYIFAVRSKDIYGNISAPAQVAFSIKVTLYASWWAIIIYAAFLAIIFYFYRKWKFYQHLKDQYKLEAIVQERTESLLKEKEKTDTLLANILPQKTADELKSTGKASTSKFKMVTVLFSDIQGFTKIAEQMNPERLIDELDKFYFQFDTVVEKYNIEKIKTIGDAYMAAGGIPVKNRTNPVEVVLAGLEMQHYMNGLKKSHTDIWDLRMGIHTGSVIAGVVGQKKFSYDIWGDTVNTASRMESSGEAGKVNISGTCYNLVEQFFECEYRGKMPVKYKGDIDMYFVKGLKPEFRAEFEYAGNSRLQVQLQLLRLQDMEEIILQRLETDIPEYLFYHNATHTAHVYTQVELLGRSEKIKDEDMLLVRTAALLHDIGYVYQFADHEIKSVEVAREILPTYRFTEEQTEKICQLILSTSIPHQPENLLEQIISDANLDHLGRVDFLILSDRLFQEYRTMNIFRSKKEWNEHQINFLRDHEFYTAAANKLREISKKDQIENIRKFS